MKYSNFLFIFASSAVGALATTVAQVQTSITAANTAAQSFASGVSAVSASSGDFADVLILTDAASTLSSALDDCSGDLTALALPIVRSDGLGLLDSILDGYDATISSALQAIVAPDFLNSLSTTPIDTLGLVNAALVRLGTSNSQFEAAVNSALPNTIQNTLGIGASYSAAIADTTSS